MSCLGLELSLLLLVQYIQAILWKESITEKEGEFKVLGTNDESGIFLSNVLLIE